MASETLTVGVTFKVKTNGDETKSADFSVDKLKVKAKSQQVTINWTLTQENTRWQAPGVVFGSDWTDDGFQQPELQGDGTYQVAYVNEVREFTYKYTINVAHGLLGAPGGVQVLSFDPEVQNQPPGPPPIEED